MILVISHSRDFSTDYIIKILRDQNIEHFRINTDQFFEEEYSLDPINKTLSIKSELRRVTVTGDELEAVYFRAPTYLRESSGHRYSPSELLRRHQWAAFVRSLIVFENCKWINSPVATYSAEIKPFQLNKAVNMGFKIPYTCISNYDSMKGVYTNYVLKALDSFLLGIDGEDIFFYTSVVESAEDLDLQEAPVILQEYIDNKLDIRVTVVGDSVFAASIHTNGPLSGDWRLKKGEVFYKEYNLDADMKELCIHLVRELGLVFGAIDLVKNDDGCYFLEINPTGEWGWLVSTLGLKIHEAIVNELLM